MTGDRAVLRHAYRGSGVSRQYKQRPAQPGGCAGSLQEAEMMKNGRTEQERQDSKDLGSRIGLRIVERIRKDGRDVIRNIVPVIPDRDDTHKWYWDPNSLGKPR